MNRSSLLFCCIISLLLACQPEAPEPEFIRSLDLQLNPSGHNPLGALLEVEGAVPSRLDIIVKGKYGEASDVQASFDSLLSIHRVPILGLYPESNNQVVLIFKDNTNQTMASDTINIETGAILADLPQIQIDISRPARMSPGMNLVSYFGYSERFLPLRPFMFDAFGDIRWYLDYSQNPVMSDLFYDTGVNRLQNGNLFFGNANNDSIYEVDMLGHTLNTWGLSGYHFHHMVIEKPDGNLVVTVTDPQKPTVEDVIIELDRETGNIVRTWDLTQSLDPARRAWPTDLADLEVEWF
ncbi:MAG: aryl-sulfate sulfotransferase, partial [Bacteroidota bacterium]